MPNHDVPEHLHRAFTYPYAAPDDAYLWCAGDVRAFDPKGLSHQGEPFVGRTPVLAIGSNRAPAQLTRKFADHAAAFGGAEATIPVLPAWAAEVDVVFSTHFSGYGALPAILAYSPGTAVRLALNWLTEQQLALMHKTEGIGREYSFEPLTPMRITPDGGISLPKTYGYIGLHRCFAPEGSPMAFAAIPATGRSFAAHDERFALEAARRLCDFNGSLYDFVTCVINDHRFRAAAMAKLRDYAVPSRLEVLRNAAATLPA